jgi:two-component system LytT family response regulator
MKVLLIEDEVPAAERLRKLLLEIEPSAEILGIIVSVKTAVKWLNENPMPDLVLMDIHLSDGDSFEIFRQTEVKAPVIFITAYDQHALEAFKVNSIGYILKPLKKDELQAAIGKYKELSGLRNDQVKALLDHLTPVRKDLQKRIIIRYGDTIKMVDIKDVAYFYTEDKITYLCTKDNLRYPIDDNLDEIEKIADPALFFRINRQYIINIAAIDKMLAWSKSRVKVILKPASAEETIVSTERSPNFKEWLTGVS